MIQDDTEIVRTAAMNQEIKRVLTEVLLKVCREMIASCVFFFFFLVFFWFFFCFLVFVFFFHLSSRCRESFSLVFKFLTLLHYAGDR